MIYELEARRQLIRTVHLALFEAGYDPGRFAFNEDRQRWVIVEETEEVMGRTLKEVLKGLEMYKAAEVK